MALHDLYFQSIYFDIQSHKQRHAFSFANHKNAEILAHKILLFLSNIRHRPNARVKKKTRKFTLLNVIAFRHISSKSSLRDCNDLYFPLVAL